MDAIKWKKLLEIHVAELDNQHKVWVGLLNRLYLLRRDTEGEHAEATELLRSLESFLAYHFRFEEKLIRKLDVDDSHEHISLHKTLIQSLSGFSLQISSNKDFMPAGIVNDLIADHILHHDQKIADSLQQGRLF